MCITLIYTAQKMKFCSKDFFSKCDQIHRKLRIWSHLPQKSIMEIFIFCAVPNNVPARRLPIQRQQSEHQRKWNTLKINNKDPRTTSMTLILTLTLKPMILSTFTLYLLAGSTGKYKYLQINTYCTKWINCSLNIQINWNLRSNALMYAGG